MDCQGRYGFQEGKGLCGSQGIPKELLSLYGSQGNNRADCLRAVIARREDRRVLLSSSSKMRRLVYTFSCTLGIPRDSKGFKGPSGITRYSKKGLKQALGISRDSSKNCRTPRHSMEPCTYPPIPSLPSRRYGTAGILKVNVPIDFESNAVTKDFKNDRE